MPFLAIPFPMIDPVAVNLGPLPLRWYALAYIGGFVLGWVYLRALSKGEAFWRDDQPRPSPDAIDDLLVYVAFGVIIGGRLGHVLIYDPGFYLAHPLEILQTWKGGMAFHGGLLGAMLGMALFARRETIPFLTISDMCAIVAPIGIFFGRVANSSSRKCGGARPTFPGRWFSRWWTMFRATPVSYMKRDWKESRSASFSMSRCGLARCNSLGCRQESSASAMDWRAYFVNFSGSPTPRKRRCRMG